MTSNLIQWAREFRKRVRRGLRDGEPELPYLPSPARVSLTTQPTAAVGICATANSAFFAKLPLEIRQTILVAAFGGRTLHMDLRFGPPLLPRSKRPPVPGRLQRMPHGGITADLQSGIWPKEVLDAARQARVDTLEAKPVWQWWGCVCHRNLPFGDERVVISLSQDHCVRGDAICCNLYPGEAPGKCQIGCMGWLTTCRQA